MIFPIWQPFAASSHQLAEKCGELLGEKTTHTGTLDPMAEGVLVILTGEDRLVKGLLGDWKKTYQFSIVWGVGTDSGDRMGIIKNVVLKKETSVLKNQIVEPPSLENIEKILQNFPKEYEQTFPSFSARRFAGKSGFDIAKSDEKMPPKTRVVTIENLELLGSEMISVSEVLEQQKARVELVRGDFRQQEIIKNWRENFKGKNNSDSNESQENLSDESNSTNIKNQKLLITHHQVTASVGTYIRQLVQDVASQLNASAITWEIARTANGPFEKEDCVEVEELEELST